MAEKIKLTQMARTLPRFWVSCRNFMMKTFLWALRLPMMQQFIK